MNKSYFNENSNMISERLREFRRERGFSQEELACICRILQVSEKDLLSDFYEKYPE